MLPSHVSRIPRPKSDFNACEKERVGGKWLSFLRRAPPRASPHITRSQKQRLHSSKETTTLTRKYKMVRHPPCRLVSTMHVFITPSTPAVSCVVGLGWGFIRCPFLLHHPLFLWFRDCRKADHDALTRSTFFSFSAPFGGDRTPTRSHAHGLSPSFPSSSFVVVCTG